MHVGTGLEQNRLTFRHFSPHLQVRPQHTPTLLHSNTFALTFLAVDVACRRDEGGRCSVVSIAISTNNIKRPHL
jgi:hypothetical protein